MGTMAGKLSNSSAKFSMPPAYQDMLITGRFSDVKLIFRVEGESSTRTAFSWLRGTDHTDSSSCRSTFDAHTSVLAASSEYFNRRLEAELSKTWKGDQHELTPSGPTCGTSCARMLRGQQLVLVEVLEDAAEVAAAAELITFFYTGALTSYAQSCAPFLLKVAKLADRYQASTCSAAVTEALACFVPEQLQLQDIEDTLQLAGSMKMHRGYQKVEQTCQQGLTAVFSDVGKVISSAHLLQQFLQLSYPAVKLWAEADTLPEVTHENSVAVLLTLCFRDGVGADCNEEQQRELSMLVRLRHLSFCFLTTGLPNLEWFKADVQHLRLLTAAAGTPNLPAASWEELARHALVPKAWVANSRSKIAVPADNLLTWLWQVSEEKLSQVIDAGLQSNTVQVIKEDQEHFAAGYFFAMELRLQPFEAQPGRFQLGCFLMVRPGFLPASEEVQSQDAQMQWSANLQAVAVVANPHHRAKGAAYGGIHTLATPLYHSYARGLGVSNAINSQSFFSTIQELKQSQWVMNGVMEVKCTINYIK